MRGFVKAISISEKKGTKKFNVKKALMLEGYGIQGDAHAGTKDREVSLLSFETIAKFGGGKLQLHPGDFAENITTSGIDFHGISIGDKLRIGEKAVIQITRIGKDCRNPCWIGKSLGRCAMPEEGLFAKVLETGKICVDDPIELLEEDQG